MENPITETVQPSNTIELNFEALNYLESIRKWTKFFSILSFVGLGLMIILALTMGTILAAVNNVAYDQSFPFPPFLLSIIYLIFAGIYVYPAISLYKFSTTLGQMLSSKDSNKASLAFKYFKGHLKYIGILTIIFISLYVLVFLISFMGILLR